jgi:hypothetical protein
MTKKLLNLSLWLALVSPMTVLADNHGDHKGKAQCSCNKECKENCKAGKTKDCKCDGKSCECKDGKPCH